MVSLTENYRRIKKIWFFILISGLLHLLVAYLYLSTEMIHYFWLSKVFLWATIANGISLIAFNWLFFKKIDFLTLPAALFDIAFGFLILVAPIIPIILLPFYVALSLLISGVIQLIQFRLARKQQLEDVPFLQVLGIARILFAGLIVAFTMSSNVVIWLTGAAIFGAGLLNITLAIRLKLARLSQ